VRRHHSRALAVALVCIVLPRLGLADAIDACTAAASAGQLLARAGKLRDARARFLECIRPECPREVKAVCDGLLSAVETSTPTVIVGARTDDGQDLVAVRVLVDGVLLLQSLDGKAVSVDPGPHAARFEHEGSPPIDRTVVIREAEKNRLLTVTFATARATPPVAPRPPGDARPTPAIVYVLAGVGVASLGGFAYLAAHGQSEYDDCSAHGCTQSTVNTLGVERALAFGTLGAGVVSLAAATWVWLARPARAHQDVSLTSSPSALGGTSLRLTF
jgi:hypothetical protein